MASGGRAPRSRTTRVAARRSSADSTASRYGSPPRSSVAVEARKTVIAVRSGALTLVGGIGPVPLLTPAAARGQERLACSPRTLRHRSAPSFARPLPRCSLPPELLLNRLGHEVLHGDLVRHAVQLEAAVKVFGDAVANCVSGSSVFAIKPPCSSTQVDDWDHADACDGAGHSSLL